MAYYNPQGGAPSPQNPSTKGTQTLQPTSTPVYGMTLNQPAPTGQVLGDYTAYDAEAAAAAAAAAAKAAEAARLRTQVTQLVNGIKDIFNSRYGQVDASAGEQIGKLNERFGNESADITQQVTDENNVVSAQHAGRGTYDSSYRGNNVDTVKRGGETQIRDLGSELQDNVGKIGSWVAQEKAGFDAQKGGLDAVLGRLAESTDPGELTSIRNTLDSRIAELRAGGAAYNTGAQNAAALNSIAPTSARTVKLQTTLSQVLKGNADTNLKASIGNRLISSAGLSPDETQRLQAAFQSDLAATEDQTTAQ